ncbi:hypothetical protein M9Y10_015990 [Tritrichomonas musculus]|uniref:Uncharacterized protein n=1 Tax=Tritrichomonas musculus TaxID=1915356 RepID=A0ABR2I7Y4_9EUKA
MTCYFLKLKNKGDKSEAVRDILLLDVASFSLGIEADGGNMTVLFPGNTKISSKKPQIFSTTEDNQAVFTVKVYEGEFSRTRNNNLLGTLDLTGIPPAPRGVPQIEVTFDADADGILNVSAQDLSTRKIVKFRNKKGRLSQADIDKMAADAEKIRAQKEEGRKKVKAKETLESYCFGVRNSLSNEQFVIQQVDKDKINKKSMIHSPGLMLTKMRKFQNSKPNKRN